MDLGTLFTVYRHPSTDSLFGMGESGDGFVLVEKSGNKTSLHHPTFPIGVSELAKRLKRGYQASPNRMYFNQRTEDFTLVHPDLDWKGLDWVLAAMPGEIAVACARVVEVVKTMPRTIILQEEIDAWLHQQTLNASHVVAFSDLPVWSLVLGQVALEHGWPLRASPQHGGAPDAPPSTNPQQWMKWLSNFFAENSIASTQVALEWTVEKIITSGTSHSMQDGASALF